jgi:hypothetical protein
LPIQGLTIIIDKTNQSTSYQANVLNITYNASGSSNIKQVNVTYSSDNLSIAGVSLTGMPFISGTWTQPNDTTTIFDSTKGAAPDEYTFYFIGLGLQQSELALWSMHFLYWFLSPISPSVLGRMNKSSNHAIS